MKKEHIYKTSLVWTGNTGEGTSAYSAYSRNHEISSSNKHIIAGSSDPAFRGDKTRYNPEELLVASLSACHMLVYLHLCATEKIVVSDYEDSASGRMNETEDGSGHFTEVTLNPRVSISAQSNAELAEKLHEKAHHLCFIANSVNFPVRANPTIVFDKQGNFKEMVK